jgi:hypothetical protein
MLAAHDVLAGRQRQLDVEGWTSEHDDQYTEGELAMAAACYAASSSGPDGLAKELPLAQSLPAQWWRGAHAGEDGRAVAGGDGAAPAHASHTRCQPRGAAVNHAIEIAPL